MTVMSEGLLLNSKYVIMGRKEGSFQASSHSYLLQLFAMRFIGYLTWDQVLKWEEKEKNGVKLCTLVDNDSHSP